MSQIKKPQGSSLQELPEQSQRSGGSSENFNKNSTKSPRQQIQLQNKGLLEGLKNIRKRITNTQITVSSLVISVAIYAVYYSQTPTPILYQNMNYGLLYHCPISYALNDQKIQKSLYGQEIRKYQEEFQHELKNSYYVGSFAQNEIITEGQKNQKKPLKLVYCGYARLYNETCQEATFACSSPGPAFDVQAHREIIVLWVNNYTKPNLDQNDSNNSLELVKEFNLNNCFNKNSENATPLCNKTAKNKEDSNLFMYDPTEKFPSPQCKSKNQQNSETFQVLSSRQSVPLSPHIHGLQVQPYYDGNPLSWWDNNGKVGVGFIQHNNQQQFSKVKHLTNPTFKKFLDSFRFNGQFKINIYRNCQQPGTLWYHDHAMGVTSFNVRLGLHSYYVIRNSSIQNKLPSGEYQKFIFMYTGIGNSTLVKDCRLQCKIPSSLQCQKCKDGQGVKTMTQQPLEYKKNYRFRILNGDFRQAFTNIRFQYRTCEKQQCKNKLNFSVIGTDSALRQKSVDNVNNVKLSPGERVDILIYVHNPSKTEPGQFDQLYVICDNKDSKDNIKTLANFTIKKNAKGIQDPITNLTLNVPFVDLSQVKDEDIYVKRMRPLVASVDFTFGINGHLRFSQGASENPKIGTIQDWYLINSMTFEHPIQEFIFFLFYIKLVQLFKQLKNENQIDKNRISGLNVLELCKDRNSCSVQYGQDPNSSNQFKYINKSADTSSYLRDYQKGWKDTFSVPNNTYAKFRIRWTRTDFPQQLMNPMAPEKSCTNDYFSIPEQELTSSPGYVYHCHILTHEDNEMMRPIMLQPSGCKKNLSSWRQRYEKKYCEHFKKKEERSAKEVEVIEKDGGLRK